MIRRNALLLAAIAVAVVQIGFLASAILGRAAVLRDGREVMLEVRPIDPRDLLRGDYVILGYTISQIDVALFADPLPVDDDAAHWNERTVYVRVKQGEDGAWQAVAARLDEMPAEAPGPDEVDMRGTLRPLWSADQLQINVRYGIERYYLPEGEGRAIETDMRERPFRVKVAVAADGMAQIKALYDGDAMLFEEPIY
jgi:uncharacterized membrane-anchored protein